MMSYRIGKYMENGRLTSVTSYSIGFHKMVVLKRTLSSRIGDRIGFPSVSLTSAMSYSTGKYRDMSVWILRNI